MYVLYRRTCVYVVSSGYRPLAAVTQTAAVAVYLFGLVTVYRAPWLAVAVHQLTAAAREVPPEQQELEQPDGQWRARAGRLVTRDTMGWGSKGLPVVFRR